MPGSIEETWGSLNKQVGSVPKQPARLGGSYCCRPQPLPSYSLYWLRKGVRSSRLQAKVVAGTEQSFLPAEEKGRKTFSFPGFLSSPSPSSVPKSPSRPTPPPPPARYVPGWGRQARRRESSHRPRRNGARSRKTAMLRPPLLADTLPLPWRRVCGPGWAACM